LSSPSFDQREQIRDAIDVVDLVERYVPLRRQGANFVGRCPWHDDSRPSLQVNPQRQTFKCWVCNIGGDVFSFVMKIENVDFKEAMQILADMAGIELVKRPKRPRLDAPFRKRPALPAPNVDDPNALLDVAYLDAQDADLAGLPPRSNGSGASANAGSQPLYAPSEIPKATLYRALEWLAGKYRAEFLHSPEAEEARAYVRDRGISDAASERFQIGYAPLDFGTVVGWVGGDRNRVRTLETAGVLAYREDYDASGRPKPRPRFAPTPQLGPDERRRYYDRFRGRLIFPIRDVQDRVVAFGGRLLPNTTLKSPAKYVNSPETPIFTKSKMVYGLDLARNAIRKTRKVVVVEGYTDCVMAAQFGFENVVAVLGTALGAEHVRMLKRFADKMILLLDGDEAGQKRTREVLRFFVEQGVDMDVLTLPNGADPCEFLLENGAEPFEELLETGTVDAMDCAFAAATAGIDLENDVVGAAKALDSLLEIVALFPERSTSSDDPVRLRMLKTIQRFASRFRVSEAEIRRQLGERRQKQRADAERDAFREQRWEERRERNANRWNAPRSENESLPPPPVDPEAERIAAFRRDWVYPIPGADDETDDELRERFLPFEKHVWNDSRFLPNSLEREYLELWLAQPEHYPRLAENVPFEALRSPITRQLDLMARDLWNRGDLPTFERVMLRYEDEAMKAFLIGLDESAAAKHLLETIADPETFETLLRDIFAGFERERFKRELPRQVGRLRESELSPEDKLQALLECRRLLQEKEENRID
jgi:DNA primase